jgi:hypothetical protein
MNRTLVIPAGCCLFAFAALLAALHGAKGREASARPVHSDVSWSRLGSGSMPSRPAYSASDALNANGDLLLSSEEAKQVLTTLAGEYLRPWREWEASPHHLYSRAAPRPIPTIYAKIEMSPSAMGQSDSLLVATIAVSRGARTEQVPCVVDRITKRVRLYAERQWLTEDEWLKNASLPWRQRRPD